MHTGPLLAPQTESPIGFIRFHGRLGRAWVYGMCGIISFLFVLGGCNGSDTSVVSHGGPVRNHVSLVDTLRSQGLSVEPTGPISQPFFSVSGQTLRVAGQDIQVFEFENARARESQEHAIAPDGRSIGQTVVQWVNPPHFFSSGTILVLYVGSDATLLGQLEQAMGKQIAGADPKS
ncbi:MAG: hypothetical protein AB7P17_11530 [Nitrospirales bacterium]|nr:hypothetical protein [Nitrospirales bacterium]